MYVCHNSPQQTVTLFQEIEDWWWERQVLNNLLVKSLEKSLCHSIQRRLSVAH